MNYLLHEWFCGPRARRVQYAETHTEKCKINAIRRATVVTE